MRQRINATSRKNYATPELAFAARAQPDGDCLIWTGSLNNKGYGQIRVNGRTISAHKYAWERVNGPVPEGMMLDHHTCHRYACVKVEHLRVLSATGNAQNVIGPNRDKKSSNHRNVVGTRHGTFYATVFHAGVHYSSPTFPTEEEAAEAAQELRLKHHAYAPR